MNQDIPENQVPEAETQPNISEFTPEPVFVTKPRVSKLFIFIPVIFILVVLIGIGYTVYRRTRVATNPSPTPSQNSSISPEKKEYVNADYSFKFEYPADIEMRDEGGTIFLSKSNSGQENISLSINAAALNDRSIKEIAESRANSLISRGIKLTKSPELTTVGTKSSYVFVSDEANPVSYIFIPVGPDNYLEVLSSINDPENTGFQSIVESIISSIDFVPTRTS